jgi:hypothetical protein
MKNLSVFVFKLFLAIITIGVVISLAAKDLAPNTPMSLVLTYAIGGTAIFVVAILVVMWLKFAVNQFLLNAGAIDTQWLWFKSNPDGLKALQHRDSSH